MSQRTLGCTGSDVETSAPRATPQRSKPTRNPQRLEHAEVGRAYTIRVLVTGERSRGDKFCRAIAVDGSEGEPCTLPAGWAIVQEGE